MWKLFFPHCKGKTNSLKCKNVSNTEILITKQFSYCDKGSAEGQPSRHVHKERLRSAQNCCMLSHGITSFVLLGRFTSWDSDVRMCCKLKYGEAMGDTRHSIPQKSQNIHQTFTIYSLRITNSTSFPLSFLSLHVSF